MKAIQINHYIEDARPILHTDVVQIESGVANRRFLCRHCGADWLESINARAQVIEDKDVENNISEYYPDYLDCKKVINNKTLQI